MADPRAIRMQLLDELVGWASKDHARSLKSKYAPKPPPKAPEPTPEPEADPLADLPSLESLIESE